MLLEEFIEFEYENIKFYSITVFNSMNFYDVNVQEDLIHNTLLSMLKSKLISWNRTKSEWYKLYGAQLRNEIKNYINRNLNRQERIKSKLLNDGDIELGYVGGRKGEDKTIEPITYNKWEENEND